MLDCRRLRGGWPARYNPPAVLDRRGLRRGSAAPPDTPSSSSRRGGSFRRGPAGRSSSFDRPDGVLRGRLCLTAAASAAARPLRLTRRLPPQSEKVLWLVVQPVVSRSSSSRPGTTRPVVAGLSGQVRPVVLHRSFVQIGGYAAACGQAGRAAMGAGAQRVVLHRWFVQPGTTRGLMRSGGLCRCRSWRRRGVAAGEPVPPGRSRRRRPAGRRPAGPGRPGRRLVPETSPTRRGPRRR